jgi:hypothetical protein
LARYLLLGIVVLETPVASSAALPFDETLAHFRQRGWMRVPQAFTAEEASAMREVVWRALADAGIQRALPSTWKIERPSHLQRLKRDPVFQAVGSVRLRAAIDEIFAGRPYPEPVTWGAFFIAFPADEVWSVPSSGWHIDANYTSALWPVGGVKTFAHFGDVLPRGGGTLILSGSHRLVYQWFKDNPPPPGARGADMRRLLQSHPYIRDLHRKGDTGERIARFMARVETVDGVALQVVENTSLAGDAIIAHPLLLHVAAPNNTAQPRFMLSGGVTTDQWGWAQPRA